MIDGAGFEDLRKYIKRRVSYARYRVGSTYHKIYLTKVKITVNRVELFNTDGQLWAHQDCNIRLEAGQTGILFWFDFTIREEVNTNV